MIQERIDRLKDYIRGIKFTENYIIAEFIFKKKWIVENEYSETIQGQLKGEFDGGMNHYMFFTSGSVDVLLDTIEEKVIDLNIENEKKDELLKQKVKELQSMFQSQDLEELQKLKFTKEVQEPSVFNREKPKKEDKSLSEVELPTREELEENYGSTE